MRQAPREQALSPEHPGSRELQDNQDKVESPVQPAPPDNRVRRAPQVNPARAEPQAHPVPLGKPVSAALPESPRKPDNPARAGDREPRVLRVFPDNRVPPELQARLDRAGRVDLQASPVKAVPLEPRELPGKQGRAGLPGNPGRAGFPGNPGRAGLPGKQGRAGPRVKADSQAQPALRVSQA